MRQFSCGFICLFLPACLIAACDTSAPAQPLNLRAFQAVAQTYGNLLRAQHREEASNFLICLQKQNLALAETLMLYQRPLQQTTTAVEPAFLHYVINTSNPLLAEQETADLNRLERSYRESLFLGPLPSGQTIATLEDLRSLGQKANAERYGRGDIVPVGLLDFDSSASGYSRLNAVWMSEMSALAYWDQGLIQKQLQQWGYRLVAVITDAATDTSAFLAEKDNRLILAFRGTSSLKNFNTDAELLKVPAVWAQGNIHHGFAAAQTAVWPQIIKSLETPNRELWVTGHSLGAALAQLTALRLTKLGYTVRAVYTYGTPRVGDTDFVAAYDKLLADRTFPHVNHQDVVTRVPPFALGFRVAASHQVRQFNGVGHELMPFQETGADTTAATNADWRTSAIDSIRKTTEFLPAFLRPQILQQQAAAAPVRSPSFSLYSTTFKTGGVEEHGSAEYLFKLVCEALEQDLWPREAKQANAGPLTMHHDTQPQ